MELPSLKNNKAYLRFLRYAFILHTINNNVNDFSYVIHFRIFELLLF